MGKVNYEQKVRDYFIYTLGTIAILLYFNMDQAYKGNNRGIFTSFALLCLFDFIYYAYCYADEERIFTRLFTLTRTGLQSTMALNALALVMYGPNQGWVLGIFLFVAFYWVEKASVMYRYIVIDMKKNSQNYSDEPKKE